MVPLDYETVAAAVTARAIVRWSARYSRMDRSPRFKIAARRYRGDRFGRVVASVDRSKAGPLIAVKLHITKLDVGWHRGGLVNRVLKADGTPLAGLYAAGEVTLGVRRGGGNHGYRALEGTFLGGCIFSGRAAGAGPPRISASCGRLT